MIVSFCNCIDSYRNPIEEYASYFWVRADTVLKALNGEEIITPINLFKENNLIIQPQPSNLKSANIDIFLWTSFVDSKSNFYDVNGLPLVPYIDPDYIPFEKVTQEDHLKVQKFLNDNGFKRLEQMTIDELIPIWIKVNEKLLEINPNIKRGLVFYDFSRLRNYKEYLFRYLEISAAMAHTLGHKGWRIYYLPYGAPDMGDGNWAHYNIEYTRKFMKCVYEDLINIREFKFDNAI